MHDHDLLVRQGHAGIERGDFGIIPFRHRPEENRRDGLAIEFQMRISRKVISDHVRARDRGNVQNLAGRLAQIVIAHRAVGSTEVDCLRADLFLAAARADRLIIETHRRIDLGVFVEPLRIDRIRESRAGAVDGHLRRNIRESKPRRKKGLTSGRERSSGSCLQATSPPRPASKRLVLRFCDAASNLPCRGACPHAH